MQKAIFKLGSLSLLTVLTILVGMSYFRNNSDAEFLSSRLSLLESQIKQSKPGESFGTSNGTSSEQLTFLQEQIYMLQNQLAQVDTNTDFHRDSQTEPENKIAENTEEAVSRKITNLQQEPELVNTIKSTGYLYEEDWKNLEQTLASMDKDENKQFWQSITSAIENNEIELYSD